jgi:hypothetical protein
MYLVYEAYPDARVGGRDRFKIFRIKHNFDLMEMAGLVVAWLIGGVWVGALLYCLGIALGICRPLNQL